MQYVVLALDGADALDRRMASRPAHIALGDKMKEQGTLLFAAALLNDQGAMIGSMLVTQFSKREDLDAWLGKEPYVTGKVWEKVEITPCKVGPSFAR